MSQQKINRRKFLQMSAAGAVGVAIASCAPATPAPTTEAPAATTAPVAAAATPTPIPTQAATATAVPTLAAPKYGEAPALAELVTGGKLPPVDERLPKNPLVLSARRRRW